MRRPISSQQADRLVRARRLLEVRIAGERRLIAAEDAARYRDALGVPLPPGLPASLLEPVAHPVLELVRRYARTHGPFTVKQVAERFGLDNAKIESVLHPLAMEGRVLEGAFRPGGSNREWCDAEILRQIRRKSLARLRREVEPVEQSTLARFLTHWQGLLAPRRMARAHLDVLLDAIENLQGAPLPASLLESAILPARVGGYEPAGLDTLIAAGEVAWAGVEALGERDGRIALFLADKLPLLAQARPASSASQEPLSEREQKLLAVLESNGASFFDSLHQAVGGGYPGESIDALWSLVWRGLITNDSLHALRAYICPAGDGADAAKGSDRGGVSFAADYAAHGAGAVGAAAGARARRTECDRGQPCPRAATAQSLRRADAGVGRGGECAGRVQRRL